jgi:hypothetical protein
MNNKEKKAEIAQKRASGEMALKRKEIEERKEKFREKRKKGYDYVCEVCQTPFHTQLILKRTNVVCSAECAEKLRLEKIATTNLKKYGSTSPFGGKEIQGKIHKILIEKYGTIHVTQNETIKEKIKQTNLERYGVENCALNKDVFLKRTATIQKRRIERLLKVDYSQKDVELFIEKDVPHFKCKTCGDVWEASFTTPFGSTPGAHFRCFKCKPVGSRLISEFSLLSFLNSVVDGWRRDRTILKGKELDCYHSDLKLAIEFDGIWWHSELAGKDKDYHLWKTDECEKEGIQLIHIFENEWVLKKELIESLLKFKCSKTSRSFFARLCRVKELDNPTYETFCNENHLQGSTSARIKLGLFYQDELVQVMSFSKPRYNKNYEWEMIRECSKQNARVIGGKGKLLKYFERNYNPQSIISYCDRRWFTGESYLKLGFELKEKSKPSYFYFETNNWTVMINRLQLQKHKLSKIPGFQFDPLLTEWENMQLNGYNRIWDCGQLVFVKTYP